jgi:hypothetical protein
MTTLLITYHGRIRAVCTPRRVLFTDAPDRESGPLGGDAPFVLAMCAYAGAVLNGAAPGPYRERDARAFARAALIPAELLARPRELVEIDAVAMWLVSRPASCGLSSPMAAAGAGDEPRVRGPAAVARAGCDTGRHERWPGPRIQAAPQPRWSRAA